MKLKNLVKLPEKKTNTCITFVGATKKEQTKDLGFNQALDQIGNLELELDVGKITYRIYMETELNHKACQKLAQTLADNFKEIIK